MDELLVRVEAAPPNSAPQGTTAMASFGEQVAHAVRSMLGLRAKVEVVAPGTYPRTDFKARRVIDDREVFQEMVQRLQSGAA